MFPTVWRHNTLVKAKEGGLVAFGSNTHGQLGLGTDIFNQLSPQQVLWEGPLILEITGGGAYILILDASGAVSFSGLLKTSTKTFVKVEGLPPIRQIDSGEDHALAVDEAGVVWALPGSLNKCNQLGFARRKPCRTAQRLRSLPPVRRVACGNGFTIVELEAGGLRGFGKNHFGQLGAEIGSTVTAAQVVPVPDELHWPLRSLSCGQNFFVVVDDTGAVWTCGCPDNSRLGREEAGGLARVHNPPMASVSAGYWHCIGVTEAGYAWGWGGNGCNQLSEAGEQARPVPLPLPEDRRVVEARAGRTSSFAITTVGELYVIGYNGSGDLGLGDTMMRPDWTLHPLKPAFTFKSAAKSARSVMAAED